MKVLVVGDVEDAVKAGGKIASLCKKQQFDLVICLGDLSGFEPHDTVYHLGQTQTEHLVAVTTKLKLIDGTVLAREGQGSADIVLSKAAPGADEVRRSLARYTFARADTFSDGPVFRTTVDNRRRLCRVVSLAKVANKDKARWHYAFNLTDEVSDDAWEKASSLDAPQKPTTPPPSVTSPRHRCEKCGERGHMYTDCPDRPRPKRRKVTVDESSCFFCLSNRDVAKHLLVSVGEAAYVALPKGAMTPGHVLVVPVQHAATRESLSSDFEPELERHLEALHALYTTRDEVGVAFEISRGDGVHIHTQVIPVPVEELDRVLDGYHAAAQQLGLTLEERAPRPAEQDYFHVFLHDGRSWTAPLAKSGFDLQFGRRVVAEAMGVPKRAHWKDCLRTEEQERTDTQRFKLEFAPYDINRST